MVGDCVDWSIVPDPTPGIVCEGLSAGADTSQFVAFEAEIWNPESSSGDRGGRFLDSIEHDEAINLLAPVACCSGDRGL